MHTFSCHKQNPIAESPISLILQIQFSYNCLKQSKLSPGGSSNNIRARSPDADSYGKNHSLPHPKGGPHQCPRCQSSFGSSQALAAHKKYHCRMEREDNKRRKLEVKRKPYRANRIKAGGEPHGHGGSTHENGGLMLKTLARSAHKNLKTKNVEVQEKEMENVMGIGIAEGTLRLKNNL